QRPDLARPCLELLAQLEPVLRSLTQQGQQGVPDAHTQPYLSSIPSILLDTTRERHPFCPVAGTEVGQHGSVQLRMATEADAAAVRAIYAPVVESTATSFELAVASVADMTARIAGLL